MAPQPESVPVEPPVTVTVKRQRVVATTRPAHMRQSRSLVLKRKGLNGPSAISLPMQPEPVVAPKQRRTRRSIGVGIHPGLVLVGSAVMAAVLVFGGGLILFKAKGGSHDKYSLGQSTSFETATLGATTKSSVNELPPSAAEVAGYKTASENPRLLTIPKLGLSSRVVGMAAGRDGLPTSVQNIFDTSWLLSSAKPGNNGVVVIGGKVAGDTKAGAFGSAGNMAVGDVMQIERGDGKVFSYKVAKVTRYDVSQLTESVLMAPAIAGKPGLNLVTTNSRFITKTNSFEQRLLIQTVQQ